ncbi:bromodomain-containing protein DDB_G0280777 isoform X2 [Condylostylus longicornis]|uniref:bromodomain-containing protein DDB_G0280777 isoform X2 n=1 Tax=Condylostylus longicornis TaxID=2530218 RepID=UPI00244DCE5E|nr:bromodomain-containing protein DDB_G0280777 isoform X2 [Condylostylus longicornis]
MKVRIGCASWLTLLLVGSSIIVVSPESSTTVTTTFQQPTMPSSVTAGMTYDKFLKNKLTPLFNFILPTTLTSITTTRTNNKNNNDNNERISNDIILNENNFKMISKSTTTTESTTTSTITIMESILPAFPVSSSLSSSVPSLISPTESLSSSSASLLELDIKYSKSSNKNNLNKINNSNKDNSNIIINKNVNIPTGINLNSNEEILQDSSIISSSILTPIQLLDETKMTTSINKNNHNLPTNSFTLSPSSSPSSSAPSKTITITKTIENDNNSVKEKTFKTITKLKNNDNSKKDKKNNNTHQNQNYQYQKHLEEQEQEKIKQHQYQKEQQQKYIHYYHYNDHKHLYSKNYQNQQHYQHYTHNNNNIDDNDDDDIMRISNVKNSISSNTSNINSNININNRSNSNRNDNNRNNLKNSYINDNSNSNNFNNNRNNNNIIISKNNNNNISYKNKRNVPQSDEPIDAATLQADLCAKFTIGDVDTQTFYSPNYPDNYPKNINCTKVITAPPDHIVRLDFRDVFNIEDKEECKFDYLEIRDGPYGFSKLVKEEPGRFCGRTFPDVIQSTERHLWLYFHSDESIEYEGFTAVYEFVERPKNVPSKDLNCTIIKKGYEGWINHTDVPQYVKDNVTEHKIPIDCMWRIEAPENWRIQTKFMLFDLKMPNDCNMNFIDIFPEDTTIPARIKNFCGSAGESAQSSSNILHVRYYAEHQAMNSSFEILYTAYRDKGTSSCDEEHEYDCEDTTCISRTLRCNGRDNCKFRWDEENCKSDSGGQSEHVVIIIVVFGLILGGMIASFLFNCIRKLVRDQKIIREHIRQSKESKLDEMGRSSVKRSGENLSVKLSPKEKHSQTSLQILDDVSNNFYRNMMPLPEIKADPILRQQHDIVAQTNLGPIIDDRESLASPDRGIGSTTCDMGCQTRESLFSPPSTTTLVRQKSLGSSPSPNQSQSAIRFSTFGYDTNNPPMGQKSKTLSRQSTINNRTSAAIELEELQYHHSTLPHNIHQHHIKQHQQQQQQQQQQPYPIGFSKFQQSRLSGMQGGADMQQLSSNRGQPEVCHHHHQHKQHLQQQQQLQAAQQQQQQQQQQIGLKLASGGGNTTNTGSSGSSSNNKQQQGKLDESKVYIDIRKSAPDVIIMTSH